MDIRELSVPGSFEITPVQHHDSRGVFLELFKGPALAEAIGHPFELQQANCSVSAAGSLRGIHFADVPPGQAKYVTCLTGSVYDVVVDIRVGSPTFGAWDAVLLDPRDRRAVYVPEGVGHGFLALEDDSTVVYLCSAGYAPGREHGIDPLDPTVGIPWPTRRSDGTELSLLVSEKDGAAPSLLDARDSGLLPDAAEVQAFLDGLSG
ncbi:dTDP-4-dehydrorhamnose 3,5-epimerase family protein [Mycobacteroides abscessus]|uniref:dTDP-4-dehydrorhamnose 3,5-epimerase family protein n=1 Tax=Mycobacteroides abscessus TaxID=36809 RepID=UPI0009A56C0B|nr:dTDP-4-dehydrorhamnose 3,5-epimerase [Mycobacteroides abscessus]SKI00879.1 DTDP-4-dehydrorhamnose 3,5-epimerase RmlC [Mycobacteroides abscessus subsp. massiliense]SKL96498.1 DTDP-4-dehydrorhamnose 3,5-epimerase RmlC [Mycobacteroides abscessus subsp. massiliense]SLD24837.1 DTDP-4-dehydrorhamnose 3,5-epimerase RmlC [Mycobacteroides abscessus subsp. massiliense]SLD45678.1 DTDP-4-dehydrorhamnose 3,5-epimerase RmlC [Mycobacteroides abscessus subsp. massiliense]